MLRKKCIRFTKCVSAISWRHVRIHFL